MQILLAILALSFLIVIHELGHFLVAKLSGIKVHEFALFMGPKLFSVQRGETMYSLRAIPLGGFVKMEGEEETSQDERAFNNKPILVRAAVIAAGPIANLLIAVIIFSTVYSLNGFRTTRVEGIAEGSPAYSAGIRNGDRIISYDGKVVYEPMDMLSFMFVSKGKPADVHVKRDNEVLNVRVTPEVIPANRYVLGFVTKKEYGTGSNIVSNVDPNAPAGKGGLNAGDVIIRVNDKEVTTKQQIGKYLNASGGNPIKITVLRDQKEVVLDMVPMATKDPEAYDIGVSFAAERGSVGESIKQAVLNTYATARSVLYSLVWLITGVVSLNQMMGPVGIVTTIGEVVQQSTTIWVTVMTLLNITSFISVNLGVFNLIPFPALDGSKLLLLVIESIRRKAIPPEKEAFISMIGLALLMMLMLFATYNDILRQVSGG